MTFRLEHYEPPELARIVRRSAQILEVEIAAEAADEISRRSRGTPRIANRILRRVRDVAEVRHQGAITTEIAREALDLLEVDERGLERIDRALLRAIVEKFEGGPVGLSTLAVSLGEEPDTIEDVYEPYLLQLGFLQRTPRGRIVTKLGRAHVGAVADADASLFWRASIRRALDARCSPRGRVRSRARSSDTLLRCLGSTAHVEDGGYSANPPSRASPLRQHTRPRGVVALPHLASGRQGPSRGARGRRASCRPLR